MNEPDWPGKYQAALDEIARLKSLLAKATEFTLQKRGHYKGDPEESIIVESRGEIAWAITEGFSVLNRDGLWEYEPLPSNCSDEFIERTRFTFEEAMERAQKKLESSTETQA